MNLKVIDSKELYRSYLDEVAALVVADPAQNTREGERLKLLALLIEQYEKNRFVFEKPAPVEAIRFRMEEMGLKQTDLVPFIGSPSKVSEILAGKRPLTVKMIRGLSAGLDIPTDVLVGTVLQEDVPEIEVSSSSIRTMSKMGWISSETSRALKDFFAPLHALSDTSNGLSLQFRRSFRHRGVHSKDQATVFGWVARVIHLAQEMPVKTSYQSELLSNEFFVHLRRLSAFPEGPRLASEALASVGVRLVATPQAPGSRLDGVAMMLEDAPVIGLTLRMDRIDSFWFSLMHELVHIQKHVNNGVEFILDNLEHDPASDPIEVEADKLARDLLIPKSVWRNSVALNQKSLDAVMAFARQQQIHPAIIAGRIRFESNDYSILSNLLGVGKVRHLFPEFSGDRK